MEISEIQDLIKKLIEGSIEWQPEDEVVLVLRTDLEALAAAAGVGI